MEQSCEKGNVEKKHKVSVGRSLTMRFSNFRNRGKTVDKCGRLTGNMEIGRPLITSLSMGAMDKALQQREMGLDSRGSSRLCQTCSNSRAWVFDSEDKGACDTISRSPDVEQVCKCMRCYRKAKGRSFDGTTCLRCDDDRCDSTVFSTTTCTCVDNGGRHSAGLMSVSVPSSYNVCAYLEKSTNLGSSANIGSCGNTGLNGNSVVVIGSRCTPVHVHERGAVGSLTKSWDRIYASRKGGLMLWN